LPTRSQLTSNQSLPFVVQLGFEAGLRSRSSTVSPSFTQRIDSFDRAPAHNQLDVFVQQFALH
jgi:hypothetical protein